MLLFNLHTHIKPTNILSKKYSCYGIYNDNIYQPELSTPFSIGIHPCSLTFENKDSQVQSVISNKNNPLLKAIGECGLDRICSTQYSLQKEAFLNMINISEEIKKPLIIHCVKAIDDILSIKKEEKPSQTWIFHGFRGKPQQAEALLKSGISLSFGAKFNVEALKIVPLNRLFIETDDENCNLLSLYEQIAEIKNVSMDCLSGTIEQHCQELFGFEKDCIKK
ncbi:MAG: TatD family hydrolase [Bacteroidales bacterium]|nr:TatD family hydrolase [Bacteroidales bacterium]